MLEQYQAARARRTYPRVRLRLVATRHDGAATVLVQLRHKPQGKRRLRMGLFHRHHSALPRREQLLQSRGRIAIRYTKSLVSAERLARHGEWSLDFDFALPERLPTGKHEEFRADLAVAREQLSGNFLRPERLGQL